MKKNYLIGILTIFSILISTLIWDSIKLPFNFIDPPYGVYASQQYHPNNDTLRYILFISLPLLTFFTSYLFFYKSKLFTINQVLNAHISNDLKKNTSNLINFFFYLIIFFLIITFFSLNFEIYNNVLDSFHEGTFLTPSKNFQHSGGFWSTTYIEYGLFANFHPLLVWNIFSTESLGSARLFESILLLSNKILLVFLCKKISENLNFDKESSLFYFVLLSIFSITLVNYSKITGIEAKHFLIILFLLNLFYSIQSTKSFYKTNYLNGLFSAASMFWWIDIGVYINFLIFLLIIHSFYRKDFKKTFAVFCGILTGWLLAFIFLPSNELIAFFENTKSLYSIIDWTDGLIYPTPFLSGDTRATKALLLIIIAGVLTIIFNFYKNIKVKNEVKIFFSFLFMLTIVGYKSAIMRSDSIHIKMSTGFLNLLIVSIALYFVINLFNNFYKRKFYINLKKYYLTFTSTILFVFFFFVSSDTVNFKRMANSFDGMKKLIFQDNEMYLDNDLLEMINYYSKRIEGEKCVQIFTNESAIPYLLDKPTCTKYYSMWMVSPKKDQERFIKLLKIKKPKVILFSSESDWFYDSPERLPKVFDFINSNYSLDKKLKHWTFVKLNEN